MRNPKRIKEFTTELIKCWAVNPELQFKELVFCDDIYPQNHNYGEKDYFYREDDFWLKRLQDYHKNREDEMKLPSNLQIALVVMMEMIWEQLYDFRFSQILLYIDNLTKNDRTLDEMCHSLAKEVSRIDEKN